MVCRISDFYLPVCPVFFSLVFSGFSKLFQFMVVQCNKRDGVTVLYSVYMKEIMKGKKGKQMEKRNKLKRHYQNEGGEM